MTKEQIELAKRRAWVEEHFHWYGWTDEEVMAFNPLPSDNFSEGFEARVRCEHEPRWIEVKDALPDEYEYVLGVTLEPARPSYAIVHLVHGMWYTSDGDEIEPTCWMRLPECQYIDAEYGGKDYENK